MTTTKIFHKIIKIPLDTALKELLNGIYNFPTGAGLTEIFSIKNKISVFYKLSGRNAFITATI